MPVSMMLPPKVDRSTICCAEARIGEGLGLSVSAVYSVSSSWGVP